jgi:hypothetical protein
MFSHNVFYSFLRSLCAFTYFMLGIFCCDRLSARAFVSESDPVKATAIPQTPMRTDPVGTHAPSSPEQQYAQMEE